ncbi:MAG: F0F1 ATP synthase subunit delta [Gammaproteobacteria bacterium]
MTEPLTVARPYAKAAFEFALAGSVLQEWESCLGCLAALSRVDDVKRWLSHPSSSAREKVAGLQRLIGTDGWPERLENFLSTMAQKGRLSLLPFVHQLFVFYRHAHERSAVVEVTSAFPLSEAQLMSLTQVMESKLNSVVTLCAKVDNTLLGGVYIQAGDLVFDHSIRGRLNRLMCNMVS